MRGAPRFALVQRRDVSLGGRFRWSETLQPRTGGHAGQVRGWLDAARLDLPDTMTKKLCNNSLAVALLMFLLPAAAHAGRYHVYSCRTPSGAAAPVDGWSG